MFLDQTQPDIGDVHIGQVDVTLVSDVDRIGDLRTGSWHGFVGTWTVVGSLDDQDVSSAYWSSRVVITNKGTCFDRGLSVSLGPISGQDKEKLLRFAGLDLQIIEFDAPEACRGVGAEFPILGCRDYVCLFDT